MGAFDRHLAAQLLGDAETPGWLAPLRDAARAEWLASSLPTRKTESWKYTSIEPLARQDYLRRPETAQAALDADALVPGLEADRIVFVNGRHAPGLSRLGHQAGVRTIRFREANAADRALIEGALGQIAAGHGNPFAALNGCWLDDGVLFHVGAGPSVVHPGMIERVDLFPGGYPARYGRFAGGIVAGESAPPRAALHGEYNVRVFDAGGLLETPFAEGRGSALVAGRYSYAALMLSLL